MSADTRIKTLTEYGALRQLKHNDGSDGFVFAYDKEATDRYIAEFRLALAATIAPAQASQDEQDEFRKWIFSDGNEDIFVKSAWSAWQARAKLAAQSASPKSAAPSSLAKQIADAKAEYDSWTPEKRASVKLEGSSEPTRGSVGRKNPL